jgi:transposase
VMASPSDLRSKILHACAKYGCEVVIATAKDGTQRCQKCGKSQKKPVKALVHRCIECDAVWDQDNNNTVNLNKASASGEVVSLVVANSPPEKQQDNGGGVKTLGGARKHFKKLLKTA